MIHSKQIVRPTLAIFAPVTFAVAAFVALIEPVLRNQNILANLRHIYLPLAVAEPLLMAAGYAGGLLLMRRMIDETKLRRKAPHFGAGVVSVLALGVISIFSQGAHLPWIITASIAAGLFAALVFFFSLKTADAIPLSADSGR